MLRTMLIASLVLASAFCANAARAVGEQEKKQPGAEPAPQFVPPPPIPLMIEPHYHYQRSDTRDVWQHYGVNSFGRFVPRVIRTPHGDFYSRNLAPYPWANLHPQEPRR